MRREDLKAVLQIEEGQNAWDGWGEQRFVETLRERNIMGLVAKLHNQVAAFAVYTLEEKTFDFLKFEVSKDLESTRVGHVLVEELKKKAKKFKKSLVLPLWEGEPVRKMQFFAKEGFKSRLKKNFFAEQHQFAPDAIEFSWVFDEEEGENVKKVVKKRKI
jgi:GNAT superfamily N-acetyltransferase